MGRLGSACPARPAECNSANADGEQSMREKMMDIIWFAIALYAVVTVWESEVKE